MNDEASSEDDEVEDSDEDFEDDELEDSDDEFDDSDEDDEESDEDGNCPYCDGGDECEHLFVMLELENCDFQSKWITEEEIKAILPDEIYEMAENGYGEWFGSLNSSKKAALFAGPKMERAAVLVEEVSENECFELTTEGGYFADLLEECPHLLELRHTFSGGAAANTAQYVNYWAEEPQAAVEWIRNELKKDGASLSIIASRFPKTKQS